MLKRTTKQTPIFERKQLTVPDRETDAAQPRPVPRYQRAEATCETGDRDALRAGLAYGRLSARAVGGSTEIRHPRVVLQGRVGSAPGGNDTRPVPSTVAKTCGSVSDVMKRALFAVVLIAALLPAAALARRLAAHHQHAAVVAAAVAALTSIVRRAGARESSFRR